MHLKANRLKKLALSPMALLALAANPAMAEEAQRWQINMKPGVTAVGQEIYDIHMLVFWICVIAGVLVFAFMFYSLFAYRKSNGHKPATFHENTAAELTWTIVPTIILLAMAWPASKTIIKIYDTSEADLDVLITGYQWKWKYEYMLEDGENVSFFSVLRTPQSEILNDEPKGEHYLLEVDNPLVLPVNKKTRFLITANDVIHAWWVPALAVKKDAIPGFINEIATTPTKTGLYRGQCAELCGKDHGFMPIVVNVVEQEEFDSWIGEKQADAAKLAELMQQQFTLEELYDDGKKVYEKSCLACHGANGEGGVGKAIAGSPFAVGDVKNHLDVVVNGVPGTAMQAFGGQLNDIELAAVITYQRNAFGNNMGDKVQPIDVYNFKNGK
ncbi:Cytochrome c oxidase subunit 2 [BD1-7 clade bacterium]|uniref:Cytochrome c oxidase subunit 2 n=1 Tax=BD1-7 clade bacterium TaxID=2029982 RepID=A0A5S9MXC3_9GAMM|nr:Cytochrome c oxidase subunit 2 [BD1-7 clade bacterium]CAA0083514.1 Cytochrome c oxidase subunit 2 [BD1-7 clade bacterium]